MIVYRLATSDVDNYHCIAAGCVRRVHDEGQSRQDSGVQGKDSGTSTIYGLRLPNHASTEEATIRQRLYLSTRHHYAGQREGTVADSRLLCWECAPASRRQSALRGGTSTEETSCRTASTIRCDSTRLTVNSIEGSSHEHAHRPDPGRRKHLAE